MKEKKKLLFIVNPVSGISHKESFPSFVERVLDKSQYDYEIKYTERAGHASEISRAAVAENVDVVVAMGGDGTINEVARCLINTKTQLGIIPSGSGNGLARHLNIPLNFEGALRLINKGVCSKIDTATINGEVFVSIAGVGFDALVAKLFAEDTNRGFFTYFKIVAAKFQSYKPKHYTLILDNKTTIETDALFIAFANSSQFGYNTTIAPEAKLNDGLLDVCVVEKPPIFEMPLIINLLLLKRIHKSKFVQVYKASEILVKRNKNRTINLDGEPLKLKKNLKIRVNPLSLNVLMPKTYEEENQ
ncbi:MAG: diacylglycerol kinase family lipid kinase [Bacteroidales bacterium]|nr:diacylglycerol kinase family lipid kinase [Bacteroidales bacterium]